jgi:hypothetical protein
METKTKKSIKKPAKQKEISEQKPKSKIALFWERNPNGIGTIVNMRAVLK